MFHLLTIIVKSQICNCCLNIYHRTKIINIQIHNTPVLSRFCFLNSETSSYRKKELFYLTTHSTHFSYVYMTSDIWYKTIQRAMEETRCRHMGYSFRLAARVLLYASSYRQDKTYHGLCYTSRGSLAGTRTSSMGPP